MACDFKSLLTVFQSYQDDGRARIKVLALWDPFTAVCDTSSNGTSSTTTLRRKILSNYQFVEKSLRRMHFRRLRHLVDFFPGLRGPNYLVEAMLNVLIICISRDIGNFTFKVISTR